MEEYTITLELTVKIEAPNASDAFEISLDTFGKGSFPGAEVIEYEVLRFAEPK